MQASIVLLEPEIERSKQVRHALESYGHHILTVQNAAAALGALRHVQFDILVAPQTPLTISAEALSTQAKLLQPQLRVLIVHELEIGKELLYPNIDACLRAPTCPSALGEAVRALLGRTTSSIPVHPSAQRPGDRFFFPRTVTDDNG